MNKRSSLKSWWRAIPSDERPGLKVLIGLTLTIVALGFAAAISGYVS
ncbi:MAG: hypothetical protein VX593_01115 [Pseudomonadota bacterium]|nr:hypothetical protein [Pseudomonadota bacterium]